MYIILQLCQALQPKALVHQSSAPSAISCPLGQSLEATVTTLLEICPPLHVEVLKAELLDSLSPNMTDSEMAL